MNGNIYYKIEAQQFRLKWMCWIFKWFFLIVHFSNKFTKLNECVSIFIGRIDGVFRRIESNDEKSCEEVEE